MHATFWSFFYLLPSAFDPFSNLLLVSLSGTQGWSLYAPAHLVQDFPDMSRVIFDPSDRFDQRRNTGKSPKIRLVAIGSCTPTKLSFNKRQLFLFKKWFPSCARGAIQRTGVTSAPRKPPLTYSLLAYA
jgi:hypothetical protein